MNATVNWLAAVLIALLLGSTYLFDGSTYLFDGSDELAVAEAAAAQSTEEDTAAAANTRRAIAEAECNAKHGRDAMFFKTQHDHLVCRDASLRGAL